MDLHIRCFVCNVKTDQWRSSLCGLVSQHSNTLITVLIRTILGNFQTIRFIDDESNSVCPDCLSRIEDCDWQRLAAQRCERELYELLMRTETQCLQTQQTDVEAEAGGSEPQPPIKSEPQPAVEPASDVNNSTTLNQPVTENIQIFTDETDRFHDEIDGEDIDDEFDDVDYDEDGVDYDEASVGDAHHPNVSLKTEHSSDEEDEERLNDDDDEDADWDEEEVKESRKPGRPRIHPIKTEKGRPGRPRIHPKKTEKGKPGRPRIHPIKTEEERRRGRPTKKTYDCQLCDQIFEKGVEFQEHKRWHREQATPKFRCPKCHYIANNQEQCDAHIKLHETAEPLQCVICQTKYSDIRTLKKHIRSHMQLRDFVCHLCGKQFFRNMSLSIHMKYHMNLRTKQCPHCPMTFVESKNLNRHLKTHTQEKPYACSICGRRFAHSYNVRPHERTHTERDVYRKFKCSFCNSAFDSKAKLATHMQKSHATVTPHLENTNKLADVEHTLVRDN